jgi:hypothetical protein
MGAKVPKKHLKAKRPDISRGATFYKSECITALLIVNKNLHFLQRFFYFCLFNHLQEAWAPMRAQQADWPRGHR